MIDAGTSQRRRLLLDEYILVVMTNAVEGLEDEFNEWYDHVHIHEVLSRVTLVSAQRFELADVQATLEAKAPYRYMTVYELHDVPAQDVAAKKIAPAPTPSAAIQRPVGFSFYFRKHGPRVTKDSAAS